MQTSLVYIALGSNLGDRRTNLVDAISQLQHKVAIEILSSVYETEPAYVIDQPRFLNMVLRGTTALSPSTLLRFLKRIEQRMGRQYSVRYGPRLIDLDILAYSNLIIEEPDLMIPHPRIAERAFVLVPLAEIAPDLRLPGLAEPVATLAARFANDSSLLRSETPILVS